MHDHGGLRRYRYVERFYLHGSSPVEVMGRGTPWPALTVSEDLQRSAIRLRRPALRGDGPGALVVEHLADAGLLLGRQLGVVDREVGADRHALLHRGPGTHLLEPALEVLEL